MDLPPSRPFPIPNLDATRFGAACLQTVEGDIFGNGNDVVLFLDGFFVASCF